MRVLSFGLALVIAAGAGAQQPVRSTLRPMADTAACPEAAPAPDSSARIAGAPTSSSAQTQRGPSLVILASATAREIRFATQPRIVVRLCGGVLDSVKVVERRNLPDPVVPGTTYRDVYVAVEILGHLNADCIARSITGDRRAPVQTGPCADLSLRDTTGASVNRPPRPPE